MSLPNGIPLGDGLLPYPVQVLELEKIARLEGRSALDAGAERALFTPALSHASCVVCGHAARGSCGTCGSVCYCSSEHQRADFRWHDLVCERLRTIREDAAFRERRPRSELIAELLRRRGDLRHVDMLRDWDAYFAGTEPQVGVQRRVLTDLASRALTLARLLADPCLGLEGKTRLTVHIIGASAKELESLPLYRELNAFWPDRHFDVALVGTALPLNDPADEESARFTFRTASYQRRLWHDLGQPDLIVGFNAGLFMYRSWVATLVELTGCGAPFALTSYRAWEARAEAKLLRDLGAQCVRAPGANPFASGALRRSTTIVNDVAQDNAFVSIWR